MKRPRGQPVCSWMKGFGGVDTFPHSCKRPAVFFDRDGIVNLSPGAGYVERWEDFHIQPEFVDVLRLVTSMGFVAGVVSNQRGVARGRMSAATVDDMHRRLCEQLQAVGLTLLDVLYCPHEHDTCDCRKPQPGMLLRASAQRSYTKSSRTRTESPRSTRPIRGSLITPLFAQRWRPRSKHVAAR